MTRHLLLILLCSWSMLVTLSGSCDTGVAFVNSILSVQRSLLANADVAFLKSYNATSLKTCMEDCCSGKYGACSVSSFKKNTTQENCLHFNCRPLNKCKFLSSYNTDSFTFSSNPIFVKTPVPLSSLSPTSEATVSTTERLQAKNRELPSEQPKIVFATYSEEPTLDDNATVKPRKGVDELTPNDLLDKSGIKPRKGVSLKDVPHAELIPNSLNKSNVKARKGVEPYYTTDAEPVAYNASNTTSRNDSTSESIDSDDVLSALQKVFEDDSYIGSTESSAAVTVTPMQKEITTTPALTIYTPSRVAQVVTKVSENIIYTSKSSVTPTPSSLSPRTVSRTTTHKTTTALYLPVEEPSVSTISVSVATQVQPSNRSLAVEFLRQEQHANDDLIASEQQEAENERKYKSSIHLVLSLVFGLLVLFAVLGVVAKRVYDSWVRRDYYRMNYLIDGIYNGVN